MRTAATIGCLVLIAVSRATPVSADPEVTDPAPPPDNGAVASSAPAVATTEDGRTLTAAAANEMQLPVPPLTTALGSRDWLVGATFTGTMTGPASGGTLEVGYQIGCGIEMNQIRLGGTVGGTINFTSVALPISGVIDVRMRPGTVIDAVVMKKEFEGTSTRVIAKDIHISVDGCVGTSSLRSYAVLTGSTAPTEDIVAYYGVPKVF